MSKIELTQNLIESLPKPENKGYILCDSWYSCKAIFNSSLKAGYTYIVALKTNRVIYPEGHKRLGIKLHKFATTLNIDDFDLVTVKDKQYYIYNYVGDLKDLSYILLSSFEETAPYHQLFLQKSNVLGFIYSHIIKPRPMWSLGYLLNSC